MNKIFENMSMQQRQEVAAKMVTLWMHQEFKSIEENSWNKSGKGCRFYTKDLEGKIMHMNADIYEGSSYRKAWDNEGNWQFENVQMPSVSYDLGCHFQITIDPEMRGCIVATRDKLKKINDRTYAARTEDCIAIKF